MSSTSAPYANKKNSSTFAHLFVENEDHFEMEHNKWQINSSPIRKESLRGLFQLKMINNSYLKLTPILLVSIMQTNNSSVDHK